MPDYNKTMSERQTEALERIADALERAYPPKPEPKVFTGLQGEVVTQSPDCAGCESFPTHLCFPCARHNGWV